MLYKVVYRTKVTGVWSEFQTVVTDVADEKAARKRFKELLNFLFGGNVPENAIESIKCISSLVPIDEDYARFQIAEDVDKSVHFTRKRDAGETEVMHLYAVTMSALKFHVLAQSEADAISQATCHSCFHGVSCDVCADYKAKATAVEVPLMVRGWGKELF